MYCVLDIEATNGKVGEEKIIEIAAYRFDGHEVVDQFISLVNPGKSIGKQVTRITGITDSMVRRAPKFYELAKRIVEITKDAQLVGHNVNFDHRMLRQEFSHLGFDYEKERIDTLPLSQQLLPNQEAYSLGKLCAGLGIPLTKRHRAAGDALATIELFKILKEKDSYKEILRQQSAPKVKKKKSINQHLDHLLEGLPNKPGVYYIKNESEEIFYIGKSKNIRQRVRQHFTAKDRKSVKIQESVSAVVFEETGNELLALVKESHEIKINQPSLNRSKKRKDEGYMYGIFLTDRKEGYRSLRVHKKSVKKEVPLLHFRSLHAAQTRLLNLSEAHGLCTRVNSKNALNAPCFRYGLKTCKGACMQQEAPESYNERLQEFLSGIAYDFPNFLVIGKGRNAKEQSFLWIQDEQVLGYGFWEYYHQIAKPEKRKNRLVNVTNAKDMRWTVLHYIRQQKAPKIIQLSSSGEALPSSPWKPNDKEFTQ